MPRAKRSWLVVPPALALLLVLGPLRQDAAAGTVPLDSVLCCIAGFAAGAVIALSWAARRRAVRQRPALLSLRESLRLSSRHRLHLVQLGDRLLLLGASGRRLEVLEVREGKREQPAPSDRGGAVPRDLVERQVDLADYRCLMARVRGEGPPRPTASAATRQPTVGAQSAGCR